MTDARCSRSVVAVAVVAGLLVAARASAAPAKAPYTRNVAIVLYDGVELLDFAGPAEVFAAAGAQAASGADPAFRVYTVSRTRTPIVSQGFLDVTPDYSIDDSPPPDIIVLPGGNAQAVMDDPVWMAWVASAAGGADTVLTVCTGAFVAGKLGLLDGLDVTTWYDAVPRLAKQLPKARVQPGRRFIDNGKIVTTAGVSAGIDGALHVVARSLGLHVAQRTAEYMEYKWSPESYLSARYPLLNPRLDARGRTLQQAAIALRAGDRGGAVAMYRQLVAANRRDAEAWLELGHALRALGRYPDAIAAHREATRAELTRGEALYGLACDHALAGQRDQAIDAAQKAVAAGFRQKWAFLNNDDLASIRQDARFQALLATM